MISFWINNIVEDNIFLEIDNLLKIQNRNNKLYFKFNTTEIFCDFESNYFTNLIFALENNTLKIYINEILKVSSLLNDNLESSEFGLINICRNLYDVRKIEPIINNNYTIEEREYPPAGKRDFVPTNNTDLSYTKTISHTYGSGDYTIKVSNYNTSYPELNPIETFNEADGAAGYWKGNQYTTATLTYIDSNFNDNGGKFSSLGYKGDWIYIKLPVYINLTKFKFKQRATTTDAKNAPGDFKIYGSNDETNWTELVSASISPSDYSSYVYESSVSTNGEYQYFLLIVNKLVGPVEYTNNLNFDEWYIYGRESEERMYPPTRTLTSASHSISGQAYGNGVYITTASSEYNVNGTFLGAYTAFTGSSHTAGWHSAGAYYNSSGEYISGSVSPETIDGTFIGEWLKIKLPVSINLTKYGLEQRPGATVTEERAPGEFKIYGSKDDTTWYELVSKTDRTQITYNASYIFEESVTTQGEYQYFVIVINKLLSNQQELNLNEWYIYGKENSIQKTIIEENTTFEDKVVSFKYNPMILQSDLVSQKTGVSGWRLVRYLVDGSTSWHPENDNLAGTAVYGTPNDNTNNWSVAFGPHDEIVC